MAIRSFDTRQRVATLFAAVGVLLVAAVVYLSTRGVEVTIHRAQYPIKHIIIIDKENRSFDEMFGLFPGANGASSATISSGKVVALGHTPSHLLRDVSHSGASATLAVDGGRMDRFDQLSGAWQDGQ